MKKMSVKKLILVALTLCAMLSFTACDAQEAMESLGTAAQSQGREYGKTHELAQNENLECTFFSLRMNSVKLVDEFAGAKPDGEGNKFLIANVTIQNTFEGEEAIPMYRQDFELSWEGAAESIFPTANYAEDMLADEYEIAHNEDATGNLVFEVPGDKTDFSFIYLEYYEDDFEGNTYTMSISAE